MSEEESLDLLRYIDMARVVERETGKVKVFELSECQREMMRYFEQEYPLTEGRFIPTKDDRDIQWFPLPDGTAARLDPMDFEFLGLSEPALEIETVDMARKIFMSDRRDPAPRLRPLDEEESKPVVLGCDPAVGPDTTVIMHVDLAAKAEIEAMKKENAAMKRVEALHLNALEAQSNLIEKKDEEIAALRARLAQHEPPTTYLEPQYPGS